MAAANTRQIADNAATQCNECGFAIDTLVQQPCRQFVNTADRLGLLAGRKNFRRALDPMMVQGFLQWRQP